MKNLDSTRKHNLIWIITLLFLFSGVPLSAQQMLTAHTSGTSDGNMNHKLNFDETNYTKVLDENDKKVFLKNQSIAQYAPQSENVTENISLSVNLVYDANQYYVSSVLIYDETGYMRTVHWTGTSPVVVSVPSGTYDIMTAFQPLDDAGKTHIVVREQQSVQQNTTVQLNSSLANNYVFVTILDENGEVLQPGLGSSIYFNRFLYFNPMDMVATQDFYGISQAFGSEGPGWNLYINDVSDRYSIVQTLVGAGFQQGNYYSKYETITGIQESISLQNDPADWSYHAELFQPTSSASADLAKAYFAATTFNGNLLSGWMYGFGGLSNPGEAPFRGFFNNPRNGDPTDQLVVPAVVDRFVMTNPTMGGVPYFTKGSPVFSDGDGGISYGSGDVSFNSHSNILDQKPFLGDDYYLMDNNRKKLLPSHPGFSFSQATAPEIAPGNNVPITVTGFKANTFEIANKGRYGEIRESDYLAIQIEVKQNGSSIFSGAYADFGTFTLPSSGEIEMILTNANTSAEGMDGINTTTITYDAARADGPPTLQHLQFRNSNNEVTDIFDSAEGASVRLAAGDFSYSMIDASTGYYAYEEGNNVVMSYSMHNQDDWTEIGLTEFPEYFQTPAFGNVYEGSLDGIGNAGEEAWYDLKVLSTDSEGNTQEQVLSPAFKINNTCQAPYPVVTNLTTTIQPDGVLLQWDPIIGSIGCRIEGGLAPAGALKTLTALGENLGSYFVSQSKLKSGKTYRWHVQCGCSNSVIGDWSVWDEFTWSPGAGIFPSGDFAETIDVDVFPNPVSSELHVTIRGRIANTTEITVFDARGSVVYVTAQPANTETSSFTVDLGSLTPGIYILEVIGDDMVTRKRFIKE